MRKPIALALVLALSLVAAGCGSDDDEDTAGTTSAAATTTDAAADCAKESLELISDGTLTIGTDNPAFPPWFEGGSPEGSDLGDQRSRDRRGLRERRCLRGRGGARLHRGRGRVGRRPVQPLVPPGDKDFDFDINQISVTDERDRAVDFSDSYYEVNQALVASRTRRSRRRRRSSDLEQYQLGAQVGTTSLTYIKDKIQPEPIRASTTRRTTSSRR